MSPEGTHTGVEDWGESTCFYIPPDPDKEPTEILVKASVSEFVVVLALSTGRSLSLYPNAATHDCCRKLVASHVEVLFSSSDSLSPSFSHKNQCKHPHDHTFIFIPVCVCVRARARERSVSLSLSLCSFVPSIGKSWRSRLCE